MSSLITKLQRIMQTKLEIKDAIATKGATCDTDCFREYPDRILAIPSGGSTQLKLQEKTVTENGEVVPDEGYDGLSKVIVDVKGGSSGEIVGYETVLITVPECKATCLNKYNNVSTPTSTACTIDGSNSWWYRTLLQYDLSVIPVDAEIMGATFRAYVYYGNDNYKSSRAYIGRLLGVWYEDTTLNWNNQPSHQAYSASTPETPTIDATCGVDAWTSADVTTLVKMWHSGEAYNYGMVIRAISEGSYRRNWNIYNRRHSEGEYATYILAECKVPIYG